MRLTTHQPARTDCVATALATIRSAMAEADARDVSLVCFPECYLGGYFPNDRDATDRAAYELGSPAFAELVAAIGVFAATLVVGFAQRSDSRLFNTAAVITRGRLQGTYAKQRPNEAFIAPGTELPLFQSGDFAFGINICNDANYPEIARATAQKGASGIVMPLNNFMRRTNAEIWRAKTVANLVARARDTNCWVVSSDVVGESKDRISHGCSAVVDPCGTVVARVPEDTVGSITYDMA